MPDGRKEPEGQQYIDVKEGERDRDGHAGKPEIRLRAARKNDQRGPSDQNDSRDDVIKRGRQLERIHGTTSGFVRIGGNDGRGSGFTRSIAAIAPQRSPKDMATQKRTNPRPAKTKVKIRQGSK